MIFLCLGEFLSLETIERWIILGFAICHPILQDPTANELWNQALSSGWVLPLFRDEVLYTHNFIQVFFEGTFFFLNDLFLHLAIDTAFHPSGIIQNGFFQNHMFKSLITW